MTKEQHEACEALAEKCAKKDLGDGSSYYGFIEGFKSAHQPEQIANLTPEQLMNSKWVKGLVEDLTGVTDYLHDIWANKKEYARDLAKEGFDKHQKALVPFKEVEK